MTYSNTPLRKTVKCLTAFLISVFAVCLIGKLFFVDGVKILRIISPSMEPSYQVNSIVIIKRTDYESLQKGDVVVFSAKALGGKNAMHRITRFQDDGFYTKGDNNEYEDNQLITKDDYVGKCIFKMDILVNLLRILDQPLALVLYVLLPMLSVSFVIIGIRLIRKDKAKAG